MTLAPQPATLAGMPHDLGPLLEQLSPLILPLGVCVWLGMELQRFISRRRRPFWEKIRTRDKPAATANHRWNSVRKDTWNSVPQNTKAQNASDQLRVVMTADFTARPLLNHSEARVFEELCQIVVACNPSWRVMAQVSLGEILSSKDPDAFSCINSKRVDMLLIDEHCHPRHAIEYQGVAHHQGTAAARDAVKKEALRRAGIGYHEVVAGQTTPSKLRRLIESLVTQPAETPRVK